MILDGIKSIGVLGFGREGLSVYEFLLRDYSDLEIHIFDQRSLEDFSEEIISDFEAHNVVLHLGDNYLDFLNEVEFLVKSPGVNPRQPEIVRFLGLGGRYTTATNLFFERVSGKTIGITGSKGKSTTSTMIFESLTDCGLESYLVGNIGEPILNYLEFDNPNVYFVVEMSSQQLEEFEGQVDYALFTSFFADHMDYHGGMQAYIEAKVNLFKNAKLTIYNGDDQVVMDILKSHGVLARKAQKYGLSFDSDSCSVFLNNLEFLKASDILLAGAHNMKNMLLVLALIVEIGLDVNRVQKVLHRFSGLEHRMQVVSRDPMIVNDSASVTPESTLACLQAYSGVASSRVIILSGMDRGYDYTILNSVLTTDDIVCVSKDLSEKVLEQISVCKVMQFDSLAQSVSYALDLDGVTVLFSPGAPSYNQFKNFYKRGEWFLEQV
jgi:UDP-N-acetylmuramoylalanine--D-glutamate ligase